MHVPIRVDPAGDCRITLRNCLQQDAGSSYVQRLLLRYLAVAAEAAGYTSRELITLEGFWFDLPVKLKRAMKDWIPENEEGGEEEGEDSEDSEDEEGEEGTASGDSDGQW